MSYRPWDANPSAGVGVHPASGARPLVSARPDSRTATRAATLLPAGQHRYRVSVQFDAFLAAESEQEAVKHLRCYLTELMRDGTLETDAVVRMSSYAVLQEDGTG